MNYYKSITFLVLLLCLTGCGELTGQEPALVEEETEDTTSSTDYWEGNVPQLEENPKGTYLTYHDEIEGFMYEFMDIQTEYVSVVPQYLADVTSEEQEEAYIDVISRLATLFRQVEEMTPPEDMEKNHQTLLDAGIVAAEVLEELYTMMSGGLDFTIPETAELFSQLSQENVHTASALVEIIFTTGEELEKKMKG